MNITITLAKPTDAPNMAEIHMRSWEVAYKDIIPAEYIKEKNATRHELWKRIVTDDNDRHYIIHADGKIAGMMTIALPNDVEVGDEYYELHGIYLLPEYFRRGIGTHAVNFAFDKARAANKTKMIVWVFAENADAIKFYEKLGFVADGNTDIREYGKTVKSIRMTAEICELL